MDACRLAEADRGRRLSQIEPLLGLYTEWQKLVQAKVDRSFDSEIEEIRKMAHIVERSVEKADKALQEELKLLNKVSGVLLRP